MEAKADCIYCNGTGIMDLTVTEEEMLLACLHCENTDANHCENICHFRQGGKFAINNDKVECMCKYE